MNPAQTTRLLLLTLSLSAAVALHAEDLVTTDGKTYKNIRLSGETPDKVKVMHDGGITLVPKSTLGADFIARHEIAAPAVSNSVSDPQEGALNQFKKANPTFTAKDGREFESASIMSIDPTGIKVRTGTGIIRVLFSELPEKVRTSLKFDAEKASEFEKAAESKRQADAEARQRYAGAASTVDLLGKEVRLLLVQNSGKGWVCGGEVLRNIEVPVVTTRAGSPFSGPKVLAEVTQKTKTVVAGEIRRLMLFGLPAYGSMTSDIQGRRTWSGKIYRVGNYNWTSASTGGSELIDAYHIDRNEAIRWIATNGNSVVYSNQGGVDAPAPSANGGGPASGTGFAISDDGYVATAAHVVANAAKIDVVIDDQTRAAHVVATDKILDVAILKVDDAKTKALAVAPTKTLALGADLFSVGFPLISQLGKNAKLTRGTLNSLTGLNDDSHTFQMSVQIQPGNSGGPVCDNDGHVIGIVSKTSSTIASARGEAGAVPQNVNFAVKADELMSLAKSNNVELPAKVDESGTVTQRVIDSTYLVKVDLAPSVQ